MKRTFHRFWQRVTGDGVRICPGLKVLKRAAKSVIAVELVKDLVASEIEQPDPR